MALSSNLKTLRQPKAPEHHALTRLLSPLKPIKGASLDLGRFEAQVWGPIGVLMLFGARTPYRNGSPEACRLRHGLQRLGRSALLSSPALYA